MSFQNKAERLDSGVQDVSTLGDILQRAKGLTAEQVEMALQYQRQHGVRFGEAAVALGLAKQDDVIWALAQQFHYPYAPQGGVSLHEDLIVANDPFCEDVEAFRDVRSQLVMGVLADRERRRALAVTSSDIGDGKSFVVANLAVAFGQLPGRTLLIDANLRQPKLHSLFGVDGSVGLSGILAGRAPANVIKPVEHIPNLFMIPAGVVAPNPAELLQRASFSLLLRELLNKFDYVLVDTPSYAVGADARVIAFHCGAALIVGRKNASRVPHLQGLVKQLTKSDVKIAGILMNEY
ncbi:MAG: polysaccharide biosynthesis tyrosine autokinase [Burkholderiales bacterium]|jgi:protein-tyrosine kinase|nr:MAG: polysaccharide biosynthesis tyrosine autokinase [Burkholderiales bacterium]